MSWQPAHKVWFFFLFSPFIHSSTNDLSWLSCQFYCVLCCLSLKHKCVLTFFQGHFFWRIGSAFMFFFMLMHQFLPLIYPSSYFHTQIFFLFLFLLYSILLCLSCSWLLYVRFISNCHINITMVYFFFFSSETLFMLFDIKFKLEFCKWIVAVFGLIGWLDVDFESY